MNRAEITLKKFSLFVNIVTRHQALRNAILWEKNDKSQIFYEN